jgi:PAS domain S-box-containing protein
LNEANDQNDVVLANLPAGRVERRLAFVVGLALLAIGVAVVPFGRVQMPAFNAWPPIPDLFTFVADLITWFLLISQFNIVRSRALLVLASGYLFAGVIRVPHLLTFSGAFSATGLLGAGLQSSVWLGLFGRAGYPLAIILYALMKKEPEAPISHGSTRSAVGASVAVVIALVLAMTWIATAGESHLPKLFLDRYHTSANFQYVGTSLLLLSAAALLVLLLRGRSVLDVWLIVAMCAWLAQGIAAWANTSGRLSLSLYAAGALSVISSTVLLFVLLKEAMTLYGRLAISLVALRQLSAEKLLRSEAFLAEAQRLSHTGSFGWSDLRGDIYWSEETYAIFECDRALKPTLEFVFQRIHPDDRDVVQQTLDRATRSKTNFDLEHRLLMPDSSVKYLHVVAHALEPSPGDLEYVGAVTDITAAKQAGEALQRSESYLAEAQRLTRTGSGAWSVPGWEALYLSEEWYRIYGFDPRYGLAAWKDRLQRMHPEDQAKVQEAKDRATREKSDYEVDHRIVLPDGTVKYTHTIGHPVLNASGEVEQFVCTLMDVTAAKEAEEKIRQSENVLRHILDFAPQQVAVLGPDGAFIYANQANLDYLGLTLEQWQSIDQRRLSHPDDFEHAASQSYDYFSKGLPHEFEMRLRGAGEKYRWFLLRLNPIRDEQGRITRWYVAGTDIEDRKQTEQRLQSENVALREEIDRTSMFEEIVGVSPVLRAVLSRVSKVAPTDSTVLVTGETGTGKELIARAVHKRSQRSSRGFVSVNCAAIPRDLIASELFGHEKGAFTGATQRRLGRFELAEGGTIFLDEVGELPAETQVALLRVLQEREFERVGGTGSIQTDVRVIAATNRDLQAAIAAGTFRSDLYYRLNVFPIEVPPLRERRDDIPVLVAYFIDRFARKAGKTIRGVDKKSMELLQSYPWPGNIRELQNVIERSVIVCDTENFSVDESWLLRQPIAKESRSRPELSRTLADEEKEMIEAALRETGGRVSGPSGAAIKLGIPGSTLDSKIRSLKIDKNRFKSVDISTDRP